MVTKDDFEAFLRKHKAIKKFKSIMSGKNINLDDFYKDHNPINYLICAFCWDIFGEGSHIYWYKLDLKWRVYVFNHL